MSTETKRIFALLIDLILIGFIVSAIATLFKMDFVLYEKAEFGRTITIGLSFSFLAYLAYFFVFDILKNSETLGK